MVEPIRPWSVLLLGTQPRPFEGNVTWPAVGMIGYDEATPAIDSALGDEPGIGGLRAGRVRPVDLARHGHGAGGSDDWRRRGCRASGGLACFPPAGDGLPQRRWALDRCRLAARAAAGRGHNGGSEPGDGQSWLAAVGTWDLRRLDLPPGAYVVDWIKDAPAGGGTVTE